MKEVIRKRLLNAALAISIGAAGVFGGSQLSSPPSPEVVLAMELGSYAESSGRHIGMPYVDKVGKGQPLTVCNGITGEGVVAGRYYTPDDCKKLELPRYLAAERDAKRLFKFWPSYNPWVRASIIDMFFNLGTPALASSTLLAKANAGDFIGMCQQMPRWVRGTVNGKSVVLGGLVERRSITEELCLEWGKDGHFSAGLLERAK